MAEEKDDLTRLEDLSEYLHETDPETEKLLAEEEESLASNDSEGPPDEFPPEFSSSPTDEPSQDDLTDNEPFSLGENTNEEDSIEEDNWHVQEAEENVFDSASEDSDLEANESPDFSSTDFNADSFESDYNEEQENVEPPNNPFEEQESTDFSVGPDSNFELESKAAEDSEPGPELEAQPEPEPEPEPEELSSPAQPDNSEINKSYENLDEVKSFGESLSPIKLGSGANPPFSLVFHQIDPRRIDHIKTTLNEYGFLNSENEKDINLGLKHGRLIISHVSEYAAITLAHKLRSECLQIEMGLSHEVRPSKEFDPTDLGQTHKSSFPQNKSFVENLEELKSNEFIFTSNSSHLESYEVIHYMGLVTEHTVIDHATLSKGGWEGWETDIAPVESPKEVKGISEDHSTRLIYERLAEKLKPHARKMKGNAIINIQYQMTPLPPPPFGQKNPQFSLTCTGNVVRVVKRET